MATLAALLAAAALAQTWNVWSAGGRVIPAGYHPPATYAPPGAPPPAWLLPGDHLQFYYWSWLVADNFLGPSRLLTNPYEFNTFLSPGLAVYVNFPYSLLYLPFHALGPVWAYNLVWLLTYPLAGLAAWLLARTVLGPGPGAWFVALFYALLPWREAEVLAGHLYGHVLFLFPLLLWCLERGLARPAADARAWAWGAGAGLILAGMGLGDPHLAYYTTLALGLYLPGRLLLSVWGGPRREAGGAAWALASLAAGAGLGCLARLHLMAAGAGFFSSELALAVGVWALLALVLWFLGAELTSRVAGLPLARARRAWGLVLAPLALAPSYALLRDLPHAGLVVLAVLGLAGLGLGLWALRGAVFRRPTWGSFWSVALPLGLGLGLAAAYLLRLEHRVFEPSVAAGGRALAEAAFFAPRPADLTDPGVERLAYLGQLLPLGVAVGLARLWAGRGPGRGRAALAALGGVLFLLLSLGPGQGYFPLYEFLYAHLPFFAYPRVPGRLLPLAGLFLALVAGWALSWPVPDRHPAGAPRLPAWRVRAGRLARWGLALLLVADLWPPAPPGLCLLPPHLPGAALTRAELPPGPVADQRLLHLPIWGGEDHRSSEYELFITRTRALTVNGYSPVVPRAYRDEVAGPLADLNLGSLTPAARETLGRLHAGLVILHTDPGLNGPDTALFPPTLALARLLAGGGWDLVGQDGEAFVLRPIAGEIHPAQVAAVTSPVTRVFEAADLPGETGALVMDPAASGWGLLFQEQTTLLGPLGPRLAGAAGNVRQARAGRDRPGFLAFGPYRMLPPGHYLARFRLRQGAGGPAGRVEVAADQGQAVLAARELPARAAPSPAWQDVALEFRLDRPRELEFRTWFSGQADLALDAVLVSFAGRAGLQAFYPAAELWRQAGELVPDPRVAGGQAVAARPEQTPQLFLLHGPQVTLEPGRYRAFFRLARQGQPPPGAILAEVAAARDFGRLPLAGTRVRAGDLPAQGYGDVELDFTLDRRAELDLKVLYRGGGGLRVAGAGVVPLLSE
ncbi:MAG: hypothetical protein KQJ78_11745 [Deltaproteobacteria bacterium]|nr:hypothetical protein [Deltaproteobacteria bacterium]